jgi:hypothetical protein
MSSALATLVYSKSQTPKPLHTTTMDTTNSDALAGEAWPRTWAATPASSRTKAESGST